MSVYDPKYGSSLAIANDPVKREFHRYAVDRDRGTFEGPVDRDQLGFTSVDWRSNPAYDLHESFAQDQVRRRREEISRLRETQKAAEMQRERDRAIAEQRAEEARKQAEFEHDVREQAELLNIQDNELFGAWG